MIKAFLEDLFSFFDRTSIPYVLMRSYESLPEEVHSTDIDVCLRKKDVVQTVEYLLAGPYAITSVGMHVGVVHLFLYLSKTEQLQLDLEYDINYEGITYLNTEDVLAQRMRYKGFSIPAPCHEYFFLLLPHFLYLNERKEKYKARMNELYSEHQRDIDHIHRSIFGHPTKHSKRMFRRHHRTQLWRMSRHYAFELEKMLFQPFGLIVTFFGPDGAGKSTLLKNFLQRNVQFTKNQTHMHLKPKHLLRRRNQNRGLVTDPHKEDPRSSWTSSVKLLVYAQEYWIEYFVNPQRNSCLHIFDRYLHDTIVDGRRYRLEEGNIWAPLISKLAPQPVVFIILDADPEIIQSRKAEVPLETTRKQCEAYLRFAREYSDRCLVVNANQDMDQVLDDVINGVADRLATESRSRIQKVLDRLR